MRLQSDVIWVLQSSKSLIGDGEYISKKAHSCSWQAGSSPYGPLHNVAWMSSQNSSWLHPQQAIQETEMEVAVILCLDDLEVTSTTSDVFYWSFKASLIHCGRGPWRTILEASTIGPTPKDIRKIKWNNPCKVWYIIKHWINGSYYHKMPSVLNANSH